MLHSYKIETVILETKMLDEESTTIESAKKNG